MRPPSQHNSPPAAFPEDADGVSDAERFRAFTEQDAAGIVEVDLNGRFLRLNQRFCEITCYTRAELLGRRFQDITHAEDLPQCVQQLETLKANGKAFAHEKRFIRKDGSVVWAYVSVSRLKSIGGADPTYLGMFIDVSQRRRAEADAKANDERYHALFNSIDAGFCVIELVFDEAQKPADYIVIEYNQAFEGNTGLRDAKGRRMRELVPAHEQHWFDTYGRIALTGEPIRFEQEARALNRWYSVYAFRIGVPHQRHVAVLFEDITGRNIAEQRRTFLANLAEQLASLRPEQMIARTAVEAAGRVLDVDCCFFVEFAGSGSRVVVSEAFVRDGTTPRRLDGQPGLGSIDWKNTFAVGNLVVEDIRRHPSTKANVSEFEACGIRAILVQPLPGDGPRTVGLVVSSSTPRKWSVDDAKLIEDVVSRVWPIIERARTEATLAEERAALETRVTERTAALQETISDLEAFSYSISHDLRAPLRAMQTYASILSAESRTRLDENAQEYLRRIRVAADRMDRLIQDVLVFSRLARVQMAVERVELASFIASVIESYPGLSDARAEIEVVSPLPAVRANPAALTQCVSNIVGNALKFTPPGVKPKIRIWSAPDGDRAKLFIRDNGIGIPPAEHERIFGMFYQIDPRGGGTGIGLAVVRKAAERMGGAVGVDQSWNGPGTTFWLELPIAKGD